MSFPVNRYSKTVCKHNNVFPSKQAILPQSSLFCDFYSIVNLFLQKARKRDIALSSFNFSVLTALRVLEPRLRSLRAQINFRPFACTSFQPLTSSTSILRMVFVRISSQIACTNSAIGFTPSSPAKRLRTATVRSASSCWPRTNI